MKKYILSVSMAFFIVSLSFQFSGCTFIGLGIGSMSDAHKPDYIIDTNSQIRFIQSGQNVDMVLRDGTILKGKFEGIQSVPEEEYAKKYKDTCAQNVSLIALPTLGEKVILAGVDPTALFECEFRGFDLGLIMTGNTEKNTVKGILTKRYPIFKNSQGNLVDLKTLDALMIEGKIPFVSGAVMRIGSDKRVISVDQISEVRIPNKKYGRLIGFLIGAGIDAAVIIAVSSMSLFDTGFLKWQRVK